jgi:prepilin-type N-terminal cleavage/methylation domain-containing protein
MKLKKGFTLLEILLVIAAIGILAAIVIVAINPNRQLAQVRNTTRYSDVSTLSDALEQYLIDNGEYPAGVSNGYSELCAQEASDCTGFLDLRSALVPTYLSAIPQDPQLTGSGSGYFVAIHPVNNKVSVSSSQSELEVKVVINEMPILDEVSGATAAYSLRRLSSTYSGNALRVRRDSDDTLIDIGFFGENLDITSLENFCSGTSCYVETWYDQSGDGNDVISVDPAVQPLIYSSTVITDGGFPALEFFGGQDLQNTSANTFTEEVTLIALGSFNGLTDRSALVDIGQSSGSGNSHFTIEQNTWNTSGGVYGFYVSSSSYDSNISTSFGQKLFWVHADASVGNNIAPNTVYYLNGQLASFSSRFGLGVYNDYTSVDRVTIGSFDTFLGARHEGKIQEVIVYDSIQEENREFILGDINEYYSVY